MRVSGSSHFIIRFQENMLFDRLEFSNNISQRDGSCDMRIGDERRRTHTLGALHNTIVVYTRTETKINKHTESPSSRESVGNSITLLFVDCWLSSRCTMYDCTVFRTGNVWPRMRLRVRLNLKMITLLKQINYTLVWSHWYTTTRRTQQRAVDAHCTLHIQRVRIVQRVE